MKQFFQMKQFRFINLALMLCAVFSFNLTTHAQVTIGSGSAPQDAALLDLRSHEPVGGLDGPTTSSGGLLLPRVELVKKNSMQPFFTGVEADYPDQKKVHTGLMVYNTALLPAENLLPGIYLWDGEQWIKTGRKGAADFFYMPSVPVRTSPVGQIVTVDLYDEYQRQFSTPKVWSAGSPGAIWVLPSAYDLYYYITDYDADVFEEISISADGKLRYKVKGSPAPWSFINVVFVIK